MANHRRPVGGPRPVGGWRPSWHPHRRRPSGAVVGHCGKAACFAGDRRFCECACSGCVLAVREGAVREGEGYAEDRLHVPEDVVDRLLEELRRRRSWRSS
jgi:hypothetical protein